MEFAQLVGSLPAQLIPLAIFAYVFNLSYIKWMGERREIIEALAVDREEIIKSLAEDRREIIATHAADRREIIATHMAERKEWQDAQRATIEREFSLGDRIATALAELKQESHAMRGKIQELLGRYEIIATPKPAPRPGTEKGGSNDQ